MPEPSERSTLHRLPRRGSHDRAAIDAILDEAWVAYVGIVDDGPVVVPMSFARDGDRLLLHGSSKSRLMQALASGAECCVTVTLLDALVLARSQFNHSMNYRSVVVFGRCTLVPDDEKPEAMRRFVDHLLPGRSAETRPADERELRATMVVSLPLGEASAKVRSGPPGDDGADLELDAWAGLVPLARGYGAPEPAPGVEREVPPSVRALREAPRSEPP